MKILGTLVVIWLAMSSPIVLCAEEANTSTAYAEGYTWRFVKAGVNYGFPHYTPSENTIVGGYDYPTSYYDEWDPSHHSAFVGKSPTGVVTVPSVLGGVTITRLDAYVFEWCNGITTIIIPSSITNIDWTSFHACTGLVSVVVSEHNSRYYSCDGIVYDKRTKELVFCPRAKNPVRIFSSPKSIGPQAFLNCDKVVSIDIPSSVTNIGRCAFQNCESLVDVTFHDGLVRIGEKAFENCCSLWSADLPSTVTTIDCKAFTMCRSLASVTIPAGIKSIGDGAFSCCLSLSSVTSPMWPDRVYDDAGHLYLWLPQDAYSDDGWGSYDYWTAGYHLVSSQYYYDSSEDDGINYYYQLYSDYSFTHRIYPTICDTPYVVPKAPITEPVKPTETAALTVTNIVVHYIVNSVRPDRVIPAAYDAGFVNIITEVKSDGAVSVPATWMVNYPTFVQQFGNDFTKALMKPTGKVDANNQPMCVWQDYVAGTDPTDKNDIFTASITTDANGKIIISYTPELSEDEKSKRVYTTYGKVKLQDENWTEIPAGHEDDYNFFKVSVKMK